MSMIDLIPNFDQQALMNLRENALRLEQQGGPQQAKAAAMLPLIDAELAERKAREPVKVTKPRAKKAVAKVVEVEAEEEDED